MQDCFAYKVKETAVRNNRTSKTIECVALNVMECEGCNFYKTREQHETDKKKALIRIMGMDLCEREGIMSRYLSVKNRIKEVATND